MNSTILAAAVALAALSQSGCAARSDYMTEQLRGPISRSNEAATVVFVRPSSYAAGMRATILDTKGRFLGDSLPSSYFAVSVPPGEHVFISWAENTAALRAKVARGKIYFIEVASRMGALTARMHLLGITPRSESWKEVDGWLRESQPYVPNEAGGQAYLKSRSEDVAERIARGQDAIANYTPEELAERTINPDDGK